MANIENRIEDPTRPVTLVTGGLSTADVTETVCSIVENPMPKLWYTLITLSAPLAGVLMGLIGYLIFVGTGIWGNNNTVYWGFPIVNLVFWIGIGHAGTLISAILFLFRQKWRTGINRFAETMTIFAVICAGIWPGIHVGRIWVIHFIFPLPYSQAVWPNFRSPLVWDVFAIGTYMIVSILFWSMGLIPDFATLRDRAKTTISRRVYGVLAAGWRGGNRQWHRYEKAYLLLAGLATPLVLSVHSVVSFDFATSQLPGWHTTIFPPYFVAGAVFGGFAMVMTIVIPARKWLKLENIITPHHLDMMAKILLATGSMVGYAYAMEFFIAWYGGNPLEMFTFVNRAFGPMAWAYWIMVSCNVLIPQIFWVKKLRHNILIMWIVAVCVNIGMWFERFVIIVTSLTRDFLPSSWAMFKPTWVDITMLAGSLGLFATLFLLFLRFAPIVSMAELKTVMPEAEGTNGTRRAQADFHGSIPHQIEERKAEEERLDS
ncbi:MAG: polysulfide reductase NrfD [Candidatus Krumholzibacteria bacterium]|nr:polysulfide reductase NrfD [Candidatus Krumholzibacteria bacterium]MDP6668603.1 polysulfide reductase NrfD [Candidatus Krumholzibacteria bacterium]MDP7021329.1 polysulfide reductase NrfD [Candidatus Krumholzibacteria bacterium]